MKDTAVKLTRQIVCPALYSQMLYYLRGVAVHHCTGKEDLTTICFFSPPPIHPQAVLAICISIGA